MVRTTEGPFGLALFHLAGTALTRIWPVLSLVVLMSVGVDFGYEYFDLDETYNLTTIPFSLIGLALSIFLGFRNSACYDRYWEGRKLWGRLVNNSRTFTRVVLTLVEEQGDGLRRDLLMRQIAFVHALRMDLRDDDNWEELSQWLPADEIRKLADEPSVPTYIAHTIGEGVRRAWKAGRVVPLHVPFIEQCLAENSTVQGACERIKNTPLPLSYTALTHRIVGLYVLGLPFGLHLEIGFLTPIVVFLVAYAFLGLDAIGSEIEDPFDKDHNDLPLSYLSRMIEREILRRLGVDPLPPNIQPVDGFLR